MAEERFWNTDEYVSTAKFTVQDGAMTMRQAGRIFRLDPAPPKVEEINDYIIVEHKEGCKAKYNLHVRVAIIVRCAVRAEEGCDRSAQKCAQ